MELLYYISVLFLNLLEVTILFSIVAIPFYIPTNSAQGSLFLCLHQHLLFLIFFIISILTDVRCYFIVFLICISLIIIDFEHLFMNLLATCLTSLGKSLFKSSAHLLIRLFCFA